MLRTNTVAALKVVKQAGGKTVTVALRGNEPGAAGTLFRLSTVLATVTVTTP